MKGILPIRPMYHLYPEENDAYLCANQYTFGSELFAAPFTTPIDGHTRLSRQVVWLPEGDWFDFFSGEHFSGKGWIPVYGDLERIPVFACAGAIVPLGSGKSWPGTGLPDALTVNIFPGASNHYQLYEDDGETQAYQDGAYALTSFDLNWSENQARFTVHPVEGEPKLLSNVRVFKLVFHAFAKPDVVNTSINGQNISTEWKYQEEEHRLVISDIVLPVSAHLEISIHAPGSLLYSEDLRKETLKRMLSAFALDADVKQRFMQGLDTFLKDPMQLEHLADRLEESHILALIETWIGLESEKIPDDPDAAFGRIISRLYHG
jgi:hypothetical protein